MSVRGVPVAYIPLGTLGTCLDLPTLPSAIEVDAILASDSSSPIFLYVGVGIIALFITSPADETSLPVNDTTLSSTNLWNSFLDIISDSSEPSQSPQIITSHSFFFVSSSSSFCPPFLWARHWRLRRQGHPGFTPGENPWLLVISLRISLFRRWSSCYPTRCT